MKLHELLKIRRLENNLTQEQLADKVFVTYQSVSKWESGVNIPSLDNLLLLSDLYNISLDELVRGSAYFKKPFVVGKKITIGKLLSFVMILICTSLFVTGFGYLPMYITFIVILLGIFFIFPTVFKSYWIIENKQISIQKYDAGIKKVIELVKDTFKSSNKKNIPYADIESIELLYKKIRRMSPFDFNPDFFILRVVLKNNEIISLPIYYNITSFLPQFFSFIKKKNINVIDTMNLIPVISQGKSVYTFVHENY